jgi:hypothetical protein
MMNMFYANLMEMMKKIYIMMKIDHASNDTEDPVIFYKSSKDIMKSYFSVHLDELKFEVDKYRKVRQVDFIRIKNITLYTKNFLLYMYHKLNFEIHMVKHATS